MSEFLETARSLAHRGWSVIPIANGKKPACPWKPYQRERAGPDQLRDWFTQPRLVGLAVVCGKVSGDLAVRDFDDMPVYERWRGEHPDWAEKLPTVSTRRGKHVYFRSEDLKTRKVEGGELRGEGNYVISPPSRHSSGAIYEWSVPLPDGPLPLIEPADLGLAIPGDKEAVSSFGSVRSVGSVSFTNLVRETLPRKKGQRNACLLGLARGMKFRLNMVGTPVAQLKELVRTWHAAAEPNIGTKEFDETWADFVRAWERAKHPLSRDFLDEAAKRIERVPLPKVARGYDTREVKRLVGFCHQLALLNDQKGRFFLSYAAIEKKLDIPRKKAHRLMRMLLADNVLECVRPGRQGPGGRPGSATRWRYLAL